MPTLPITVESIAEEEEEDAASHVSCDKVKSQQIIWLITKNTSGARGSQRHL